jgi:hypothetical protein
MHESRGTGWRDDREHAEFGTGINERNLEQPVVRMQGALPEGGEAQA